MKMGIGGVSVVVAFLLPRLESMGFMIS